MKRRTQLLRQRAQFLMLQKQAELILEKEEKEVDI